MTSQWCHLDFTTEGHICPSSPLIRDGHICPSSPVRVKDGLIYSGKYTPCPDAPTISTLVRFSWGIYGRFSVETSIQGASVSFGDKTALPPGGTGQ